MFVNKHISENDMIITTTKSYMSNYYFSKEKKKEKARDGERKFNIEKSEEEKKIFF